jgi:solute carrier family 25 (mitochondrial folate transporter), member 32
LKKGEKLNYTDIIIASSISKVVASVVAYPHEVLRSQFQDKNHDKNKKVNLLKEIKIIYNKHGLNGFYKGMGTNLIRVVPSASITLTSFEFFNEYLHNYFK